MVTFLVGICGGEGSGTSTFASDLQKELGADIASLLHFNSYYCDLGHLPAGIRSKQNFHHPDLIDSSLLAQHLDTLSTNTAANVPLYDFENSTRIQSQTVQPTPIILVEGSLLFAFTSICSRLDYLVFRDCPEPARLASLMKPVAAKKSQEVAARFYRDIKPMHDLFVQPNRRKADLITHAATSQQELVMRLAHQILTRSQPSLASSYTQPAYSGVSG